MNLSSRRLHMKSLAVACTFSFLALPGLALAAGYLKIGDIKGESPESRESGQAEILSWSWGEANSTRTSGLPTGKRQHKPFKITKPIDTASPSLKAAHTSGQAIPAMELALPQKGGRDGELVKYKLKEVYVTSYSVNSTDGSSAQTETFTLAYAESTVEPAPTRK